MRNAQVLVAMGSTTDGPHMNNAIQVLDEFGIIYERRIVSAHRTPVAMWDCAKTAYERGIKVIIAGAGGAAHLPGMMASYTHIPVIGVPCPYGGEMLSIASMMSMSQMPYGVPVATMGIGAAGARNAAILAIQILALRSKDLTKRLISMRKDWTTEKG